MTKTAKKDDLVPSFPHGLSGIQRGYLTCFDLHGSFSFVCIVLASIHCLDVNLLDCKYLSFTFLFLFICYEQTAFFCSTNKFVYRGI